MPSNPSMLDFIKHLNNTPIPSEYLVSNGGRIPDFYGYGDWLFQYDRATFDNEYKSL